MCLVPLLLVPLLLVSSAEGPRRAARRHHLQSSSASASAKEVRTGVPPSWQPLPKNPQLCRAPAPKQAAGLTSCKAAQVGSRGAAPVDQLVLGAAHRVLFPLLLLVVVFRVHQH